jgi:predicted DNA-binding transcriptional regulator AlpA
MARQDVGSEFPRMATDTRTGRRLINAHQVGEKLGVHLRSACRPADEGRIPAGVRIATARRWDERELDDWISKGCPPVRREAASV